MWETEDLAVSHETGSCRVARNLKRIVVLPPGRGANRKAPFQEEQSFPAFQRREAFGMEQGDSLRGWVRRSWGVCIWRAFPHPITPKSGVPGTPVRAGLYGLTKKLAEKVGFAEKKLPSAAKAERIFNALRHS